MATTAISSDNTTTPKTKNVTSIRLAIKPKLKFEPAGGRTRVKACHRSQSKKKELFVPDGRTINLSLLETQLMKLVGSGRSGDVYRGVKDDMIVAYKIPLDDDQYPALQRERRVYAAFAGLQGQYLPKVYFPNVKTYIGLEGMGMEFLQCLPHHFRDWTNEQRTEVENLLKTLANHGLYQNDIRPSNFGTNSKGKLVMFDVEDVYLSEELKYELLFRKKYLKTLNEIIGDDNDWD